MDLLGTLYNIYYWFHFISTGMTLVWHGMQVNLEELKKYMSPHTTYGYRTSHRWTSKFGQIVSLKSWLTLELKVFKNRLVREVKDMYVVTMIDTSIISFNLSKKQNVSLHFCLF